MEIKIINEREYQGRFKEISQFREFNLDNDLKVRYSLHPLKRAGQIFQVNPPIKKSKKLKQNHCYANSISKRHEGYGFVEGIITSKETGTQISHAWNVDSEGNHVDFTIMDTHKYDYWGIILPSDILITIGTKNGNVWYCNLPYIVIK